LGIAQALPLAHAAHSDMFRDAQSWVKSWQKFEDQIVALLPKMSARGLRKLLG